MNYNNEAYEDELVDLDYTSYDDEAWWSMQQLEEEMRLLDLIQRYGLEV